MCKYYFSRHIFIGREMRLNINSLSRFILLCCDKKKREKSLGDFFQNQKREKPEQTTHQQPKQNLKDEFCSKNLVIVGTGCFQVDFVVLTLQVPIENFICLWSWIPRTT